VQFYSDLAEWWPWISPVEDYAEEAAFAARLLSRADGPVREILELGSGGGHNAAHLKRSFALTLVDLSPAMLDVSRSLNPECDHVAGDMREIRLGRVFDAVFVHDAIDYMTTRSDLGRAVDTAFAHCRPGGVAVFMPDHTTETFQPSTDHGGVDRPDGGGIRYLEWSWPGDGSDGGVSTHYSFVIRSPQGQVATAVETHRTGLFDTATWIDALEGSGFSPELVTEETEEDRIPRLVFVGHRPGSALESSAGSIDPT
jgi:SAM-dependent methyltransferase